MTDDERGDYEDTITRLRTRIAELESWREEDAETIANFALGHVEDNDRIKELERELAGAKRDTARLFTHEAADAFWRIWDKIGEPHKHGVYESTWAGFRAAIDAAKEE